MHCWARYLFTAVVIALGTLSMLGACGHEGPLYLPPPEGQAAEAKAARKAAATPQPADLPLPAQPPRSDAGLMAWPAEGPGGCTSGCTGGTGAKP